LVECHALGDAAGIQTGTSMAIFVAFFAGVLTTIAGMGGGTLLVLFLILTTHSPVEALAATSVGLLVGNVHRLWLFRQHLDRQIAVPFTLGALPAAAVMSWVAVSLPDTVLQLGIAAVALVGVASAALGVRLKPRAGTAITTGALVGGVSATTGGGGIIAGPFFLTSGLSGPTYIATAAAGAIAVHLGRLAGYGSGGVMDREAWLWGMGFALAILLGNLVGKWLRQHIPERANRPIELGTAAGLATLAIASAL
jgi:uncharacterized membrane protein YfcA